MSGGAFYAAARTCTLVLPGRVRTGSVSIYGSCVRPAASDKVSTMVRMSRIDTESLSRFCRVRVRMPKDLLDGTRPWNSLGDLAPSLSSSCRISSWLSLSLINL